MKPSTAEGPVTDEMTWAVVKASANSVPDSELCPTYILPKQYIKPKECGDGIPAGLDPEDEKSCESVATDVLRAAMQSGAAGIGIGL